MNTELVFIMSSCRLRGGDGRLWLWDIFKCNYRREPDHRQRIKSMTLGGHYAQPIAFGEQYSRWSGAEVIQGFSVRVRQDDDSADVRTLDHDGFPVASTRPFSRVTVDG